MLGGILTLKSSMRSSRVLRDPCLQEGLKAIATILRRLSCLFSQPREENFTSKLIYVHILGSGVQPRKIVGEMLK
jgi:hypothetical protein